MKEINEDPADRARKYLASFERVLSKLVLVRQDSVTKASNIAMVSDMIKRYVNDARYYLENNKPTTSLVSIAYAEGLLDALSFLELAQAKDSQ